MDCARPPGPATGISQQLRAMQVEFVQQGLLSCTEIGQLLDSLKGDPQQVPALNRLARVAHDLAGSAGAYGFLSVTEQARDLTEHARTLAESERAPAPADLADWEQLRDQMQSTLSLAPPAVPRPSRPSSSEAVTPPTTTPPTKGTILCLEDQPVQVAWLRHVLQSAGYAFAHCSSLEAFDTAFRSLRPDLLLLDVELPDGSGHSIAQTLRESSEHSVLPIVFITGTVGPNARMQALGAGGDDYLPKPVPEDLLLTAVAGRIQRARAAKSRMERDGLTGLLNRVSFVERAEVVVSRLRRSAGQAGGSMVVIDVDHFKSVNDRYGHSTGDQVLKALAGLISETLRCSDLAGRLGGEEFALLLEAAQPEDAQRVCERILKRFSAAQHRVAGNVPLRVTFSAGIAGYNTAHGDLGAWLDVADITLYRAKTAGRNRVLIATPPVASR